MTTKGNTPRPLPGRRFFAPIQFTPTRLRFGTHNYQFNQVAVLRTRLPTEFWCNRLVNNPPFFGNLPLFMLFRFGYLFTLVCLLSSVAQAQSSAQSTKKFIVGLKIGANFSQLDELSYQLPPLGLNGLPVTSGGSLVYDFFRQNDARSTGLVGGVFARFGKRFYVQPELLFSVKGGRFDIIRQGLETQSVDVKVGSIDLPVLVGMRLGPFRLNAGPMASLNVLSGNLKESLNYYGSQALTQTIQQTQVGYQAGAGLSLGSLHIDVRREGGFKKRAMSDPVQIGSLRPKLWQLTVGYNF